MIHIKIKSSSEIAEKLRQSWLRRYPLPIQCVHDNGGGFVTYEFQQLLYQCYIKSHRIWRRNPQLNAICERMHQIVGNILRTLLHANLSQNINPVSIIDEALSTTIHSLWTTESRSKSILLEWIRLPTWSKEVSTKLGTRSIGPFPIHSVHTNGTTAIIRKPGIKN